MDIMTMMMSSMTQGAAMPGSEGGVPGKAVDASGKSPLFATLLGTTMHSRLTDAMSEEIYSADMPEINLAAQMKNLLSQQGADSAVASQSETGSGDGKDLKVASMLQLLQRLKSLLEATGNETTEEGSADKVGLLTAELRDLLGQDSQSLSETVEKLQGRLNPAVIKKEAELDGLAEKAVEANPENQNASVQLTALLTALNGLLPQAPKQSLDKNVEPGKVPEQMPLTGPEIKPEQQNAAATQDPETANSEDGQAFEQIKKLVQRADPGNAESGKSGALITPLLDQKVAESSQQKSGKVSNLSASIHPALMQAPIVDEERGAQSDKPLQDSSIEVVIAEEQPMQEGTDLSSDGKGATTAEMRDLPKGESFQVISADSKPQLVADRPVAEEGLNRVSREQIVSQVREKLAEQRITQENGQVTIKLNPAELGELKIMVRMDDQRLRVEIVAENRAVKDALMENLGSLKEALARQNLEVKQFDVSTGSRQFFNQGFSEGRQQEQQYVTPRKNGWLTGRMEEPQEAGAVAWQRSGNALLDTMM